MGAMAVAVFNAPRGGDDPFERLPYQLSMVVAVPTVLCSIVLSRITKSCFHFRVFPPFPPPAPTLMALVY